MNWHAELMRSGRSNVSTRGNSDALPVAWTTSTVQLLEMYYTETDVETSSAVSANCQILVGSTNGLDLTSLKIGQVRLETDASASYRC